MKKLVNEFPKFIKIDNIETSEKLKIPILLNTYFSFSEVSIARYHLKN